MPSIQKVLIANRGEIALRVIRTCHELGIATVAVYSEPDTGAPFVTAADEAVALGGAAARESYLVFDKILAAAAATGADAIHPGYGLLSENADFASACADAGRIFVGPSPEVIRRLGGKRGAKELARAAGVPTIPGYAGADQSLEAFAAAAGELGFPLLLKASAGGGGKGMHVVRSHDELGPALERARRVAAAAFGDDTMLLERYLERPRHIEVQILGDHHGNLIHLYERDCSLQRRHQKILEEAPAPGLAEPLRDALYRAALAVGRAVGYQSAGTVELIVDTAACAAAGQGVPDGAFYFLEVNTRLQVEHPVTEAVCGVDLVAEQLRVARGERLRLTAPPPRRGHAIEVRLCAEDPRRGYLPTTGAVAALAIAGDDVSEFRTSGSAERASVRCDLGVVPGSVVGIHYDSMLGKVIAHGATRDEAAALLGRALGQGLVAGLPTNVDLLTRVLRHPAFLAGEVDTDFLARFDAELTAPPPPAARAEAAIAAALAGLAERGAAAPRLAPPSWRNVPYRGAEVAFVADGERVVVGYRGGGPGARDTLHVTCGDRALEVHQLALRDAGGGSRWLELTYVDGARARRRVRVARAGATWWVAASGATWALEEEPRFSVRRAEAASGSLLAPMPGKVVKVLAAVGDRVPAGAAIAIIEAMKMEHTVGAPGAGTLVELRVAVGQQVEAGALLAVVAAAEPGA